VDTTSLAPHFDGTGYPRWKVLLEAYLQAKDLVKDRLGDQRGGSEWEPIKILLEGD
jgi:hypothetical protein